MSHDFSQYDQPFESPGSQASPPQKKGCSKGCLFLLILLGLIIALLIGLFVWMVQDIARSMTQDPQEIQRRLLQRYPSARMPAGYEGKAGFKVSALLNMELLVFGKDDTVVIETGEVHAGDSLILFSFKIPGIDQIDLEEALDAGNNGGKLIEKKQRRITTGEFEFDGWFQKVLRPNENNEQKLHYQLIVPLDKNIVVLLQSDTEKLDEPALKQFLLSIARDCPTARKVEK